MSLMIALLLFAQQIPTPNVGPFGAAVSPDGATLLVPEFGSFNPYVIGGTVAVIDTATDSVTGTIAVGMQPEDVAFTPDGAYAFVTNAGGATVSVIDMATQIVVATTPCGEPFATFLYGVAIDPDGKLAYVNTTGGNWDGSEENIFILDADPASPTFADVVDTVEISGGFTRGGFRAQGDRYVVARGFADNDFSASPRVSQFHNGVLVSETIVVPAVGGFHGAEDLVVTPNGKYAYLPVWNFTEEGSDEVFVIDLGENKVIDIVRLGSGDNAQHGITSDPSGLLVLATNFFAGSVSVIFTPTNTVIDTIPVESLPNEVVFTPDGLKAYVTNQGSNSVSVIPFAPSLDLVVSLAQTAVVDPSVQKALDKKIAKALEDDTHLAALVKFIKEKSAEGKIVIGLYAKDTNPPAEDLNNVDVGLGGIDTYTQP